MKTIVVKRTAALGDVILTTPIIERLHRTHPKVDILVATHYKDVFRHNPLVVDVVLPDRKPLDGELLFDLDLVYEHAPTTHVVKAYMQDVFGDDGRDFDLQQKLYTSHKTRYLAHGRYVVVNPTKAGWANRTLPSATWIRVCELLKEHNYSPIVVGSSLDMIQAAAPSFYVSDIHAHAELYSSAACFVGADSALLHVAGATMVPIVGVYTSVRPQYRLPIRNGELGWKCKAVVPEGLDCIGCHERQPIPSTIESCERGDLACIKTVTAEQIVAAVLELIGT